MLEVKKANFQDQLNALKQSIELTTEQPIN